MSFEELEREVKQDILAERWRRFLPGIIALITSVVLGVGGYKGYQYYQEQESLHAAQSFYHATNTLIYQREEGLYLLEQVIQNPEALGYQPLAQFALASEYIQDGNLVPVRDILLDIADNPKVSAQFVALATLQAAMISGDAEVNQALSKRLVPYLSSDSSWRHLARIAEAELALSNNDTSKAREIFTTALEDEQTPPEVRQRIGEMLSLL